MSLVFFPFSDQIIQFLIQLYYLICTYTENPNLKGQVSVGTFNSFLYRGTLGFEERKDLLIKTVSIVTILHLSQVNKITRSK